MKQFLELSKEEQISVLFRIRADILIDAIPLKIEDLELAAKGKLSAQELLERLLFIPDKVDWNSLIKDAIEESKELSVITKTLTFTSSSTPDLYYCKMCAYEGTEEDFLSDGSEELKCPECGALTVEK